MLIPARDAERMRDAYRNFRKGYSRPLPKPPEEADAAARSDIGVIEALVAAARAVPSDPEKRRADSFASLTARLRRLRDIAIVETLRATGVWLGELVALRRGDLGVRHSSCQVPS